MLVHEAVGDLDVVAIFDVLIEQRDDADEGAARGGGG
jgi:hypothetical protein